MANPTPKLSAAAAAVITAAVAIAVAATPQPVQAQGTNPQPVCEIGGLPGDFNSDGTINNHDALILYHAEVLEETLRESAGMRRSLLGLLLPEGRRTDQDFQAALACARMALDTEPAALDFNNDNDVDSDDALIIYNSEILETQFSNSGTAADRARLLCGVTNASSCADADLQTVVMEVRSYAPPIADAGADQSVTEGDAVVLDGGSSIGRRGMRGDITAYAWAQTGAGMRVALSGADTATASFTAPNAAGALSFVLTVTDERSNRATDTVVINVASSNTAPVAVGTLPAVSLTSGLTPADSANINLSAAFSDPDQGDTLTFSAAISPTGVATAAVNGGSLTVTAVNTGSAQITVTATDQAGATAQQSVAVMVSAPPVAGNTPPQAVGTIPAQTLTAGRTPADSVSITLAGYFSDADANDTLQYTVATADSNVATAEVVQGAVVITAAGAGSVQVTVSAEDSAAQVARQRIAVTVEAGPAPPGNNAPTVSFSIPAQTLTSNVTPADTFVIPDLNAIFTDADAGDSLTFVVSSSAPGVATAVISGNGTTLTITPISGGTTNVVITATDAAGAAVSHMVEVTVEVGQVGNSAPTTQSFIPTLMLTAGQTPVDSVTLDLSARFTDPDGDPLTFSARNDRPDIITATLNGDSLTIAATGNAGNAQVALTVRDTEGASLQQTVFVQVVAPARSGPNSAPILRMAIGDSDNVTLGAGASSLSINLWEHFSDSDYDELQYTVFSNSNGNVVGTAINGGTLTLFARGTGVSRIRVQVDDNRGGTLLHSFNATVMNAPPRMAGSVPAQTLTAGLTPADTVTIALTGLFTDPDRETLRYGVSTNAAAVASVSLAGAVLRVRAVGSGVATITVEAFDPRGGEANQNFIVRVLSQQGTVSGTNNPPIPRGRPENYRPILTATLTTPVNVSGYLVDPDGDPLTISVRTRHPFVVQTDKNDECPTCGVDGTQVTMRGVELGVGIVDITAEDGRGGSRTRSMRVEVRSRENDPPVINPGLLPPSPRALTAELSPGDSVTVDLGIPGLVTDDITTMDGGLRITWGVDCDLSPNENIHGEEIIPRPRYADNHTNVALRGMVIPCPEYDAEITQNGLLTITAKNVAGPNPQTPNFLREVGVLVDDGFHMPNTGSIGQARIGVLLEIRPHPNRPLTAVANGIADLTFTQTIDAESAAPREVNLLPAFNDPDNVYVPRLDDPLSYSGISVSGATGIVTTPTVRANTNILEYNLAGPAGTATINVTATDSAGNTASNSFSITVENAPPEAIGPPIEVRGMTTTRNDMVERGVADDFRDPGNDALTFSAVSDNTSLVQVSIRNDNIMALSTTMGGATGATNVTVTATDAGGLSASKSFPVMVATSTPPEGIPTLTSAGGNYPRQPLTAGGLSCAAGLTLEFNWQFAPIGTSTFTNIAVTHGDTRMVTPDNSTVQITLTDAGNLPAANTGSVGRYRYIAHCLLNDVTSTSPVLELGLPTPGGTAQITPGHGVPANSTLTATGLSCPTNGGSLVYEWRTCGELRPEQSSSTCNNATNLTTEVNAQYTTQGAGRFAYRAWCSIDGQRGVVRNSVVRHTQNPGAPILDSRATALRVAFPSSAFGGEDDHSCWLGSAGTERDAPFMEMYGDKQCTNSGNQTPDECARRISSTRCMLINGLFNVTCNVGTPMVQWQVRPGGVHRNTRITDNAYPRGIITSWPTMPSTRNPFLVHTTAYLRERNHRFGYITNPQTLSNPTNDDYYINSGPGDNPAPIAKEGQVDDYARLLPPKAGYWRYQVFCASNGLTGPRITTAHRLVRPRDAGDQNYALITVPASTAALPNGVPRDSGENPAPQNTYLYGSYLDIQDPQRSSTDARPAVASANNHSSFPLGIPNRACLDYSAPAAEGFDRTLSRINPNSIRWYANLDAIAGPGTIWNSYHHVYTSAEATAHRGYRFILASCIQPKGGPTVNALFRCVNNGVESDSRDGHPNGEGEPGNLAEHGPPGPDNWYGFNSGGNEGYGSGTPQLRGGGSGGGSERWYGGKARTKDLSVSLATAFQDAVCPMNSAGFSQLQGSRERPVGGIPIAGQGQVP